MAGRSRARRRPARRIFSRGVELIYEKERLFGKLIYGYDKLEEYLLCGSLVCTTLIVFAQVIMRKVFNDSLAWSEELTRYIFIWQIWLGVSIAQRDKQHIKVELLKSLVKNEKVISVVDIFAMLVLIAFNVFLVINGSELVNQMYPAAMCPARCACRCGSSTAFCPSRPLSSACA